MNNPSKQNIVIIGGGMVGASMAIMLAEKLATAIENKRINIFLVEQHELKTEVKIQPGFDDRSTALSAGSCQLLKNINCWESLAQDAEKIKDVHVSDHGHFSGTQLNANKIGLEALGYVVENKKLGQVLGAKLKQKNIKLISPAMVKECHPTKKGYQLSVDCQDPLSLKDLHADLLIVADGADSPLRKKLGITSKVNDYNQLALIANVSLQNEHNGIAYERFTDEGPLALLPLPSINNTHRASLVWTLDKTRANTIHELSDEVFVEELQQRFGYRVGKITAVGKRQLYELVSVVADEQIRSHLAIVGNAAHFLHPVAGQGFNLALRDCSALTDTVYNALKSKKNIGHLSVLKSYLQKQITDQDTTIGLTHALVKTFSSNNKIKMQCRQLGLLALTSSSFAKRKLATKMMGLNSKL